MMALSIAGLVIGTCLGSLVWALWRICWALQKIGTVLESGIVQTRDIDRAKVYSEHLGKKLSTPEPLGPGYSSSPASVQGNSL